MNNLSSIQIACMTSKTRQDLLGVPSDTKDQSIHILVNGRRVGVNNTKPARTRSGKKFPGGRTMRRVLTKLTSRQNEFNASPRKEKYTNPGSRQG